MGRPKHSRFPPNTEIDPAIINIAVEKSPKLMNFGFPASLITNQVPTLRSIHSHREILANRNPSYTMTQEMSQGDTLHSPANGNKKALGL